MSYAYDLLLSQNASVFHTGIHLAATVNSREKRVGMEVYIDHDNSKAMFKQLLGQKDAIEAELKVALDWQELPDGHACRIIQFRPDSPLEDEARWPAYFAWLEAAALSMSGVFRPRVRELT